MGTNKQTDIKLFELTGCEINPSKVKYLGVHIDRDLKDLFQNNYGNVWSTICYDLMKWTKQQFSWSARMAIIKMNILPTLNFYSNHSQFISKKRH